MFYNENGAEYFEGRAYGNLSKEKAEKGFFMILFLSQKITKFLLQICSEEKNAISHTEKCFWINFLQF